MIANSAFLAALTTFVIAAWLAAELTFLAPYKAAIFRAYGVHLAGATVVLFLNLCGAYYMVARWLFLRDAGRKLTHIDRQLRSASGLHDELRSTFRRSGGRDMSFLDDPRWDDTREGPSRGRGGGSDRDPREVDPLDPRDAFTQGLDLPRGLDREPVWVDGERYDLRGSEYERWRLSGHSA